MNGCSNSSSSHSQRGRITTFHFQPITRQYAVACPLTPPPCTFLPSAVSPTLPSMGVVISLWTLAGTETTSSWWPADQRPSRWEGGQFLSVYRSRLFDCVQLAENKAGRQTRQTITLSCRKRKPSYNSQSSLTSTILKPSISADK